jgi:inhibitor of KinA sporulation pathway (predicted exonuclease)
MKNFLALDLEMNQPSNAIIQVGICIGNRDLSPKDYKYESYYVKVDEEISEYITNLTGITNDDIRSYGRPLEDIAKTISDLMIAQDCVNNPVTWGSGDAITLLRAFALQHIEFKHFGRRCIDVKTIYTFLQLSDHKNVNGGLSSCMGTYNLNFIGKAHGAEVDAMNTMRLFFYLLERQTLYNSAHNDIVSIQNLKSKYN